jgi:pimeloyl-ACP methyl ester carboxylesterase
MNRLITIFALFSCLSSGCAPLTEAKDAQGAGNKSETVVLLHGFGRSNTAMWLLARRLQSAGYNVVRVGYDSLQSSPGEILQDISQKIEACCKNLEQPVHFVGHSLGGLMIRAYLGQHKIKQMGRAVLIGTPNEGTPLVDIFKDSWWMQFTGPTARALGTDSSSFPNTLPVPDYPLGIIAGVTENGFFSDQIPGKDDGLVPVESTFLEGMSDFIIIETNHTMMRYNEEVALQAIEFLKRGKFSKQTVN